MKIRIRNLGMALLAGVMLTSAATALAGSKKLMSINAAKVLAERAVVESVVGLKIMSTEKVEDMVAKSVKIDAKTSASIKGIRFTDLVYDKARDIAKAEAEIEVARVVNIVGRNINYGKRVIRRVAFATSTPSAAGPLKALRAAELDAYRQLAKQIVGFELESRSSVEDFILKSDKVRTELLAAIYGAELTGYRWDNEGDAYVTLSMKVSEVEDVLGQRILFNGDVIEVEGVGAQKDDFNESVESGGDSWGKGRRINASVREGSLDIPMGPGGDVEVIDAPVDTGGAYDLYR